MSVLLSTLSCGETEKTYNRGINITPKPMELTRKNGHFVLKSNTVFVTNDGRAGKIADFFIGKIKRSTGFAGRQSPVKPPDNYIELKFDPNLPLNDEGYTLDVDNGSVTVSAKTPAGLFYGMQTFMQLLPAEIESPSFVKMNWTVPGVSVKDEPRFRYRGQMLDVCRHFRDIDYIKKQLDVLAMFKINKFHFHLTEDQGWRVESKKYPKLNEISTKRTEGEGTTYGPYYFTQAQLKEIVAYAKERFIEVIPEVELPGHGVAALTAYPEYSCTGGPFEVRNVWGVANDVYCAGNDETFVFLTNIIEEVIPLFESEYFHIGGDECPKGRWENCPKCQARMKKERLKDAHELQSWFIAKIEKVLLKHNKKMIGWDEILEGGLAPSATVMSWRGEQGGIDAANMGHDVIMTPGGWLYLDHYQGDSAVEPPSIGGYTTLEKTYSYEPIPAGLKEDKKHHVLGAQGNLWAEYIHSADHMEYMTYPRIIALSEVTWTQKEGKDYKDFERRLDNQLVRLDGHGVNYHIPVPEQKDRSCNFIAFTDTAVIELKTTRPMKIVYTTDGGNPEANSEEYVKPLVLLANTTLKVRSVLPSGKKSTVRTIKVEKQEYLKAVVTDDTVGYKAEHYKGKHFKVAELKGKTPDETEYVKTPGRCKHWIRGAREIADDEFYSSVLTGLFEVPETGIYYISSHADELWIDDKLQIVNEGNLKKGAASDKTVALEKGKHKIKILRLGNIIKGWPSQWDAPGWRIRPYGKTEN